VPVVNVIRGGRRQYWVPVPDQARAHWVFLSVCQARQLGQITARVLVPSDSVEDPGPRVASRFLRRTPGLGVWTVAFVPPGTSVLNFEVRGIAELPSDTQIRLLPISRLMAALLIALCNPLCIARAMRGPLRMLPVRVRQSIAVAEREANTPRGYSAWISCFDNWHDSYREMLLSSSWRSKWPRISIVVFYPQSGTAALAATLASLRRQWEFADVLVHAAREDDLAAPSLREASSDYVALLQAGELVPAHALAVLADQVARHGWPDVLCADEDALGTDGQRREPSFKPEINHALAISGTLTRGIWLFRRAALVKLTPDLPGWAEAVRLDAYLRLYECVTPPVSRRVPFVLTHRRHDTDSAPNVVLESVVRQHLLRAGMAAELSTQGLPLRWRMVVAGDGQPKVTLIVPSAARSPHVANCLMAVLQSTAYRRFEMLVVVSQDHPLAPGQQEILAPIMADPRARAVVLDRANFNYSAANNFGASVSDGELLCLLNDDVKPIEPRWLEFMVGHLTDPRVGAVGARLIYPDGLIQHGGIIMGLGGLCEHAFRYTPRDDPGYCNRAVLEQEVSAATGAALLVRRNAFEAVGGLDESYPITFNDVDFCLRLREAGWSVVLSAAAELQHFESTSIGHHFSGERAALEQIEVVRMRRRWRSICSADPFHNPNLMLAPNQEWTLAYPPRVERPFAELLDEFAPLDDRESHAESCVKSVSAISSDASPRTGADDAGNSCHGVEDIRQRYLAGSYDVARRRRASSLNRSHTGAGLD
jgi:GT2 family glycosyltransferase